MHFIDMIENFLASIDWFSFALGVGTTAIVLWILATVGGWLRSTFQPKGSQPFGQRLMATMRSLITGLLILGGIALVGYIVYSAMGGPAIWR